MRIRKMINQGKGFDRLTNSLNHFVKEYVEISHGEICKWTPQSLCRQAAIRALTLSGQTLVFKSISVIFYILHSRVSEVVSNFKSAVHEMLPALFIPANINWKASLYPYAAIDWRKAETLWCVNQKLVPDMHHSQWQGREEKVPGSL